MATKALKFDKKNQEMSYKGIACMLNNDNDEKKAYFNGACMVFNEHPLTIDEKASKIIDYIVKEIKKNGKFIGTIEFIDYVIESLKQKKHLDIYGRGHSLMLEECKHNNKKNIFTWLDDLKKEYINNDSSSSLLYKTYGIQLPEKLDTTRANKYFKEAINKGWLVIEDDNTLKSTIKRVQLAFLCEKIYCPTNTETFPETALNNYFRENRLGAALTQFYNNKKEPKWVKEFNNLFVE